MSQVDIVPAPQVRQNPQSEPRIISKQEQYLQDWKNRQKREQGKITYITPPTDTRELISMQTLERAMSCIGILSVGLAVASLLAIIAVWYTAWVIPALLSLAGVAWIGVKWKEWWR